MTMLKEFVYVMELTGALLVLSLLVSPITSEAKCREPRDCNPTSITPREICNFHKVYDDLYRGGRPSCIGLAKLEALGIRTFIDLGGAGAAIHPCKAEAAARGIRFIRVKIRLPKIILTGVSDAQLRDLFATMRNASKPIFVSCSLGRDRTGMVVALYRMRPDFHQFETETCQCFPHRRAVELGRVPFAKAKTKLLQDITVMTEEKEFSTFDVNLYQVENIPFPA